MQRHRHRKYNKYFCPREHNVAPLTCRAARYRGNSNSTGYGRGRHACSAAVHVLCRHAPVSPEAENAQLFVNSTIIRPIDGCLSLTRNLQLVSQSEATETLGHIAWGQETERNTSSRRVHRFRYI